MSSFTFLCSAPLGVGSVRLQKKGMASSFLLVQTVFTVSHFFMVLCQKTSCWSWVGVRHSVEVNLVGPVQKGQMRALISTPVPFCFSSCPCPSLTLFIMSVELPLLWGWETQRCIVQGRWWRWKKQMSSSQARPDISGCKSLLGRAAAEQGVD